MKRFLSLTIVAIMLLSTLMLTSCDFINQAKDFAHNLFGIGDDVRYTITEDEWNKVGSIDNFTMTMSEEYGNYTINISMEYTTDAAKICMGYVTSGGNMDVEYYFDIKAGCLVEPDGMGNWIGYEGNESGIADLGLNEFISEVNFSDLAYDEATKSYIYDDKEDKTIYNFYFENGSLIRLVATSTDPEYPGKATIDKIGTTTVTLPEYTVEK